ncbi:hypothetical protein LRP_808 [Ligilactobacillus ruminis]|nr:hypothetical protein LRP_808 [Ligilactobacillus ruminis]
MKIKHLLQEKIMDNGKFIEICKNEVVKYTNDHLDKQISSDDVYVVWLTKALQNNKALLSTTLLDGMYYELTYNGDKNELYIDVYKRLENKELTLGD